MNTTRSSEGNYGGYKLEILGALALILTLILSSCGSAIGYSEVLELSGNVKLYQAESNQFEAVVINQRVPFNQALLTGEDSWVRLGLFGDGSAVHIEALSSLTLLSDEQESGQPVVQLRLDIGSVYLAPKSGVISVEIPVGFAFADSPGAIVHVSYDPQTGMGQVACMAGMCKVNTDEGGMLLAADQSVMLGEAAELVSLPEEAEEPAPAVEEAEEDNQPGTEDQPVSEAPDTEVAGDVPACGPPEGWQIFTVGEGQSFDSILNTYQVTVDEFQQANCLGNSTVIVPGMHLFVPAVELAAVVPTATPSNGQAKTQNPPKPKKTEPTPTTKVETVQPTEVVTQEPTVVNTQASTEVVTKVPTEKVTQAPTEAPTNTPTSEPTDVPAEPPTMRSIVPEPARDYVSNPGMGWQFQGGTYPMTYPNETVAYAPRSEISWKVLNPAEGVYDWSALDAELSMVISQGKQFSFRVYTMRGESYGGHQLPQWVIDKGAKIFPDGQVDYSNCTYQAEWGKFVNQMISRYDGNSNIAFIDISGYGNFNEWSWQDQTEWDQTWADAYSHNTSSRATMSEMDSFARRVLADMFIGGSYGDHQCITKTGQVETVSYSYKGFAKSQLLMPYAGTIQASQYVHSMDPTVGFRHDCLGREGSNSIVDDDRLGKELDRIWPKAPVVFENCEPYTTANAEYLLGQAHGSIVHDANVHLSTEEILNLLHQMGYKYQLMTFDYTNRVQPGEIFRAKMTWQNQGNAPSYPRMGQTFELHLYLYDQDGNLVKNLLVPANISLWMPASSPGGTPPTYTIVVEEQMPFDLNPSLVLDASVAIIDTRTGKPIWLPFTLPQGFDYK